jgi:hypothetical protein
MTPLSWVALEDGNPDTPRKMAEAERLNERGPSRAIVSGGYPGGQHLIDTQRRQNDRPVKLLVRLLKFKPDCLRPGHARIARGRGRTPVARTSRLRRR